MKKMEKIFIQGKLLAIILKAGFRKEGIEFFTPSACSLQLAYMNRPKGYIIKPHKHNAVKREVLFTREALFVKSGVIRADFYLNAKKYAASRILRKGDTLFLIEGGHGFEFIKKGEMIEVKQGPFFEEKDASRFEPAAKNKLKVKK